MSGPERIWIEHAEESNPYFYEACELSLAAAPVVEYRRADLPPTLPEALAVPEVAALVEAAYKEGYSYGYHTGNPHKNIHADWEASKARAALAAIDPGPLT